jgi:hypothetical protein
VAVAFGCLTLAACNPLLFDPRSQIDLDETGAQYTGPDGAWLEVSVFDAGDVDVYALGAILLTDIVGPTARSCVDPARTVVPCTASATLLTTPNQRVVPGDGTAFVRLLTLWSGERASVVLVCVDRSTFELGCPTSMRGLLRTVDDGGAAVGDLRPAS